MRDMSVSRKTIVIIVLLALPLVVKCLWTWAALSGTASGEGEKADLLRRRDYLIGRVVSSPEQVLAAMPSAMLSAALTNMAIRFPEEREGSAAAIDSLVRIAMSEELRSYDRERWGEDPLAPCVMEGEVGHLSYYSHLAWMIGGYKRSGGDGKYDVLHDRLCEALNRRIVSSPTLNVQTYPREPIYVPDMLVAIVALSQYSRVHGGRYSDTVRRWLDEMKERYLDQETGLIESYLPDGEVWIDAPSVRGSYSALSCYYLTFIEPAFAREQYGRLKQSFLQRWPVTGIREYYKKRCLLGMDIDSGPVIMNLSPSGTAFAMGPATYFEDTKLRRRILRTGELAGTTVTSGGKSHYLLANVALVGEAIMLAMRTAVPWY
jgi:hypothetical protein